MRPTKPKTQLSEKEEELMQLLWQHGAMSVSQLLELYSDPKPHFNTVSTVIRRLESNGFVAHHEVGGTFQYFAVAKMEDFRNKHLKDLVKGYFGGSYFGAVSALVEEEKISADELRELLNFIEKKKE
ncbi:MAG: BlaI/MecI/CopY family transcriptional regulator [Bacteroidaceae bacterium]|nr:BlaI/MecI/CopY family transcriptional regulator [Bacteroidaceae bacterium]